MSLLPRFLYPGPLYLLAATGLAFALDALYPYHSGPMLTVHPVHTSFVLATKLYRPRGSRARGLAIWLSVLMVHAAAYGALLYLAWLAGPPVWVVVAGYVIKTSISLRLLIDTVDGVGGALRAQRLDEARSLAQGLVRRDLSREDPGHVASAAVESLAESLVDGLASPLLWLSILGPLGALSQRVVNTLDGALGFKDPDHVDIGFVSAWADTIMNYVPARLTALIIALASPAGGGSVRNALSSWLTCAGLTESRNAGHPMSAMSGAVEVALEKRGSYTLCAHYGRLPNGDDVNSAIRVSIASAVALAALTSALTTAFWLLIQ